MFARQTLHHTSPGWRSKDCTAKKKGSVGSEGENTKTCICYIIYDMHINIYDICIYIYMIFVYIYIYDICIYIYMIFVYIYIVYSYDIYIVYYNLDYTFNSIDITYIQYIYIVLTCTDS